jgi:hypothetical protein
MHGRFLLLLGLASVLGCSSEGTGKDKTEGTPGGGDNALGTELELNVEPDSRTFVSLKKPALVDLNGDGSTSIAWDLAFLGRDVFINGGISGPGNSSAFGPLSAPTYLTDTAPEVPLLLKDRAGGALLDWYDYVGGTEHLLFSRYHVYGLRDGDRLFKLQILSYYGEQQGAPVSALYRIRFAEVLEGGVGPTHELSELDATAGGTESGDEQPEACVDLSNQDVIKLTPAQAAESSAWHVCFRRGAVAVNGGLSGPRGVEAVDLQADDMADEAEVQERTEESELPAFDAVDYDTLVDDRLDWRADGVATAFGRRWLEPGTDPAELSDSSWLVVGADGASKYMLKFESLSGELGEGTATLSLRAKHVR